MIHSNSWVDPRTLDFREATDVLARLQNKLTGINEPKERAENLIQQSDVYVFGLRDVQKGSEVFRQAVELDPDLKEKFGAFLVDGASRLVKQQGDLVQAYAFLCEAAENFSQDRTTEEKSFSLFLQALALQPQNPRAFLGLARICGQRKYWTALPPEYQQALEGFLQQEGRWEDLVRIFQSSVEVTEDSQTAADTYLRMGQILEKNLNQNEPALNAYKMASSLAPQDSRSFFALKSVLQRLKRHQELYELLESHLEFSTDTQEIISALAEMAKISLSEFKNSAQALALFERIQTLDPAHFETYQHLAGYFTDRKDYFGLLSLHKERLQNEKEPRLKAYLHEAIGLIFFENLGKMKEARFHFEESLKNLPENSVSLRKLDFIYSKDKDWTNLVAVLKARSITARNTREKARGYRRLAQIFWDHLGDLKQAEQNLRNMVDLTPEKELGLALLVRFYRQVGDSDGIVSVFRERVAFAETLEAKRQALIALAVYLEHELKRPSDAEKVFVEIQTLDPGSIEARQSLKRLYREQERWQELEGLYLADVAAKRDEVEMLEALTQLAELNEYQMNNIAGARKFYEQALGINIRNLSALKGLERICVKQKDWPAVVHVYRRGLELAQDIKEEAYIHLRLAQIFEQMIQDSADSASSKQHQDVMKDCAQHYEAALLRDPSLMVALKSLIPIYEKLEQWDNSVRVRKRYVETVDDTLVRAENYFRIGEVLEKHLNKSKEALSFLESAARLDPDHLGALRRLAAIYFQNEEWTKALSVHEALESHLVPKGADASGDLFHIYYRLGQIFFKLNRPKDAIASFLEARKIRQDFVPLNKSLADIYYRQRDWGKALQGYASIVASVAPEEQIEIWMKMATAQSEKGLLGEAEKSLLEVLKIRPLHEHATESLVYLYKNSHRFDALAKLYQQRLSALDSPDLNVKEGLKLIQIQVQLLSDTKGAIDTAKKLFKVAPKDPEVFRVYCQLLKQTRSFERLKDMLEQAAEESPETISPDILNELGELYESKKEWWEKGLEIYAKVLLRQPENLLAIRGIGRLLVKRKAWREVIENYQLEQRLTPDDRSSAVLSFKIGEVLATRLNKLDDAVLSYKDALTKNPQLVQAIRALKKIFYEREEFEKIAPLVISEIENVEGRGEEAYLHHELGRLFEEKMGLIDKAIKHYENALALIPSFGPSARKLAVYYYQEGNWPQAEKYYDVLAKEFERTDQKTISPRVAAGFFYKLGRISERLEKEEKAIHCFRKSLFFDGQFFPALSALEEICEKKGWFQEAKLCLEQILRSNRAALEQPSHWHFRLAFVEERLGNRDLAIARYKEVLNLSPKFVPALEALIRLYEEDEKWRIVIGFFDRLLQAIEESGQMADVVSILLRKGKVFTSGMNDFEKGVEVFQEALQMAKTPHDRQEAQKLLFAAALKAKQYSLLVSQLNAAMTKEPTVFATPENYLALAEAYLVGFSDFIMAEKMIHRVLEINPNQPQAHDLQDLLLQKTNRSSELIDVLEKRLDSGGLDREARSLILQRLGDLYLTHEEDSKKSVAAFRRALELDANNLGVHRKLAEVYSNDAQYYGKAIEENHFLIKQDPFNFEVYHRLGHIYELRGEQDRSRTIYEVLQIFGQANEREVKFIRSLGPRRVNDAIVTRIPNSFLEGVIHPDEKALVGNFWPDVASEMEEAFAQDEGRDNLQKYDEIFWEKDFDEHHPLRQAVRMFDLSSFMLRAKPGRDIKCQVFSGTVPTLLATEGLLRSPHNTIKRFHFSRALAQIVFHHAVLLFYSPEQLRRLFLLLACLCLENFKPPGMDEKALRADLKVLKKVFSKKRRIQIAERNERFLQSTPMFDYGAWKKAIEKTGNRCGLLLNQDFKQALELVGAGEGPGLPLDVQRLRNNEFALDLFVFSTSLEFFNAREKIGLGSVGLII